MQGHYGDAEPHVRVAESLSSTLPEPHEKQLAVIKLKWSDFDWESGNDQCHDLPFAWGDRLQQSYQAAIAEVRQSPSFMLRPRKGWQSVAELLQLYLSR
jgi:hypothetical protein